VLRGASEVRESNHTCYISNLRKLRAHYPSWTLTYSLGRILQELLRAEGKQARVV